MPINKSRISIIPGVKSLPMRFSNLDLLITKIKTNKKYRILVTQVGESKNGAMAISWVTDAVLGDGKLMEMP